MIAVTKRFFIAYVFFMALLVLFGLYYWNEGVLNTDRENNNLEVEDSGLMHSPGGPIGMGSNGQGGDIDDDLRAYYKVVDALENKDHERAVTKLKNYLDYGAEASYTHEVLAERFYEIEDYESVILIGDEVKKNIKNKFSPPDSGVIRYAPSEVHILILASKSYFEVNRCEEAISTIETALLYNPKTEELEGYEEFLRNAC